VVADPGSTTDVPDVMFGSGINEVAALLARFPDVPVVQISQQWDNWASFPSPLPQVMFHVPVDELNVESLANQFGVAPERIRIVHNAVDISRLRPRERPLPMRPSRALVFVKHSSPYVAAVRAACESRSIEAHFIGPGAGCVIKDTFAAIAGCDLVVGSARTAIEGAAGGAAVLVADHRGLAGLLTTDNLQRFRGNNFGREILTRPVDSHTVGEEIDRYDPLNAAAVAIVVRDVASLDRQLQALESIFSDAVTRFAQAPPAVELRRKALSAYLSRHLPKHGESSPRHAMRADISDARLKRVSRRLSGVTDRLFALEREVTSKRDGPLDGASFWSRLRTAFSAGDGLQPKLHGEGRNLLKQSEALDRLITSSSFATIDRASQRSGEMSKYLIAAFGGESEHYIQHTLPSFEGPLTFSLDVHELGTPKIRIQLLNDVPSGAYADFDLPREDFAIGAIGEATSLNGGANALGDRWYKVWITAHVARGNGSVSVVIQLADERGSFAFKPTAESVLARALQVERGAWPSIYLPT
jgi:hypothetical protein